MFSPLLCGVRGYDFVFYISYTRLRNMSYSCYAELQTTELLTSRRLKCRDFIYGNRTND
jgi:hypothetical protein